MKKLFLRALTIMVAVGLTCLGIVALPLKSYNINLGLADKHLRLAAISTPKIIFIGGSSLALGLDSEIVERQTHMQVVNMGLNGGLGLRYMLDEVKANIRPGDIIVISPEYEHWHGSLLDGGLNMLWAIRANPKSITALSSPNQILVIAQNAPEFIQEKFSELLPGRRNPVYNRDAFNQYGDFVNHLDQLHVEPLGSIARINEQPDNPNTTEVLRAFAIYANCRNARVVYSFPPLAATQLALSDNKTAIDHILAELNGISEIQVIDLPTDNVYPDNTFFDTVYHLNADGRKTRSNKVAQELVLVIAAATSATGKIVC